MVSRNTGVLTIGAALAVAGSCLGTALLGEMPHAEGEPLAAVCTNYNAEDHQACAMGYAAMFESKQSAADCEALYERDAATFSPRLGHTLPKSDYLAGCEGAKRALKAEGY